MKVTRLAAVAVIVTIGVTVAWAVTGRHVFTKYESVEEVADPPAADDPFAAAGFYDDAPSTRIVRTQGFYFGLLPASGSLFDKHAIALTTVAAPLWVLVLARAARRRWNRRDGRSPIKTPRPFTCHHC